MLERWTSGLSGHKEEDTDLGVCALLEVFILYCLGRCSDLLLHLLVPSFFPLQSIHHRHQSCLITVISRLVSMS